MRYKPPFGVLPQNYKSKHIFTDLVDDSRQFARRGGDGKNIRTITGDDIEKDRIIWIFPETRIDKGK